MSYEGECTALESRFDLASLEGLHALRRQMLPEYAALRALHGPGGKWDAKRKAMLEAMKIRARMELTKNGEKVTEAAIDSYGHADTQYVAFIEEGIAGATRLVELETAVTEIEERIRDRESSMYLVGKEAGLAR